MYKLIRIVIKNIKYIAAEYLTKYEFYDIISVNVSEQKPVVHTAL